MRDWANPIFNGLQADEQPDCDELAAGAGGTALGNDGESLLMPFKALPNY